jgi:hypothetical protein
MNYHVTASEDQRAAVRLTAGSDNARNQGRDAINHGDSSMTAK